MFERMCQNAFDLKIWSMICCYFRAFALVLVVSIVSVLLCVVSRTSDWNYNYICLMKSHLWSINEQSSWWLARLCYCFTILTISTVDTSTHTYRPIRWKLFLHLHQGIMSPYIELNSCPAPLNITQYGAFMHQVKASILPLSSNVRLVSVTPSGILIAAFSCSCQFEGVFFLFFFF